MTYLDPIHAPCPDMEGMKNTSPEAVKQALLHIEQLRDAHGIRRRKKPVPKPLHYVCTFSECSEPWSLQ
ncbi:hypothetical protein ACTFQF_17505 [Aliivibrio fischeri]|uniref:hypothetical protein n=1 Tax=Aliivibrio fischeri TaxID=668 RepID=UPI0007C56121|nr:hypothetical protein [Aliivibrio fischeri]MBP3139219.1 hypothetical protein [Aliivibrio fischeri]MBP3154809.1 hypothetical protein [Aliivibrio fischeri]MCE7574533.1 hypothetical protein [Aliivibrio fischeri]